MAVHEGHCCQRWGLVSATPATRRGFLYTCSQPFPTLRVGLRAIGRYEMPQ